MREARIRPNLLASFPTSAMSSSAVFQLPLALAAGAFLFVLAAERLHARRCRVVAYLATGPAGQPRRWTRWVPPLRAATLGAMVWAAVTLIGIAGGGYGDDTPEDRRGSRQHIIFVADLSPSMFLQDAGPGGSQTRLQRMADVVDAVLQRIDGHVIYSVMGFYTECMPVIVDAEDSELVRNVFAGLPVWYAMEAGKTDLGTGVRTTLERLAAYPSGSTTLFVCTDGDTIEMGSIPKPPPSVSSVYVLGVGDPDEGTFIDGHMSRQDPSVLRAVAGRMRGEYLDVNQRHVPTLTLGTLATSAAAVKGQYDLLDVAIFVFAVASAAHALIPVLLQWFGSDWKAVRVERRDVAEGLAR